MFSFHPTDLESIDPRIQYYLTRSQVTTDRLRFSSARDGYIPVIARVTNLEEWEALSEVQVGETIPTQDNKYIVTARIPLSRIEEVRKKDFVETLKATQPVKPALQATIQNFELNARTIGNFNVKDLKDYSENVVVGVVDFGGDFMHQNFRNSDGTTRIARIWDQSNQSSPTSPLGYGKVYTREKINAALKKDDPYAALGYDPRSYEEGVMKPSHGTHVMDIAAGNGSIDPDGNKNSHGVAPKAELVFVELAGEYYERRADIVNTDFGDSVRLVEAVSYIFKYADSVNKPCVVNLSLGTNGGPHDGTNPVEEAFDALVRGKDNRAIVIAASNTYHDSTHKSGKVTENKFSEIQWNISQLDRTHNEVEIWYSGEDEFELELINKNGTTVARVPLGKNGYVTENVNGEEKLLCFISHREKDPNNNDNVIHLFEEPRFSFNPSRWKLRLHGIRVTNGKYNAWIERDDSYQYSQSRFKDADPKYSLGSISCGHDSITVGSYDAHKSTKPISFFSSAGPTRDGRNKPEISAPGQDVWAASSGTNNELASMMGTSMAAPAVTGLVALMFGLAKHLGKSMPISLTLQILRESANKSNNDSKDWHNQYGYGMASPSIFRNSFFSVTPVLGRPTLTTVTSATSAEATSSAVIADGVASATTSDGSDHKQKHKKKLSAVTTTPTTMGMR